MAPNGYLYVAMAGTNNIMEINPSNPYNPTLLQTASTVTEAGGITADNDNEVWVNGAGNFGYLNYVSGASGAKTTTLSCAADSIVWIEYSNPNLICPSTTANVMGHYNVTAGDSGTLTLSNGGQTNANPVQVAQGGGALSDYQYGNGSPDIQVDILNTTTPAVTATIPPIAAYSDSGAITENSGLFVLGKNLEYILACLSGQVGVPPSYETAIITLGGDQKTEPGGLVSSPDGNVFLLSNVTGGQGLFGYTKPSLSCPETQPAVLKTIPRKHYSRLFYHDAGLR